MSNRLIPKSSSVATKVPLASDLVSGEIALNTSDKRLFFKDTNDIIQEVIGGDTLPTQTGHTGKFLSTDGTDVTWENLNETKIASTAGIIAQVIETFSLLEFESGEYILTVKHLTGMMTTKLLVLCDSTNTYTTQYGQIGVDLGDFTAEINSIDNKIVDIIFTPNVSDTNIKFKKDMISSSITDPMGDIYDTGSITDVVTTTYDAGGINETITSLSDAGEITEVVS